MVTTTCYTWINTSREDKTQLHKIMEEAKYRKRVTPPTGSFFGLALRDHGSEVYSKYWELSCL